MQDLIEYSQDLVKLYQEKCDEVERLRTALKFYARHDTYVDHEIGTVGNPDNDPGELAFFCPIEDDGGEIARAALKGGTADD